MIVVRLRDRRRPPTRPAAARPNRITIGGAGTGAGSPLLLPDPPLEPPFDPPFEPPPFEDQPPLEDQPPFEDQPDELEP